MNELLFWLGSGVIIMVVVGVLIFSGNDFGSKIASIFFIAVATFCLTMFGATFQKQKLYGYFAQEVNLQDIPIKGNKMFTCQIRINYNDGKLTEIWHEPNTTKISDQ